LPADISSAVFPKRIKKRRDDKWVLPRAKDDQVPYPPSLHEPQIACSTGGGLGGKDPGGIHVLLSNLRWERHLLRFLELSDVGRAVEDGTNVEEARAARLDGWIMWEVEERHII